MSSSEPKPSRRGLLGGIATAAGAGVLVPLAGSHAAEAMARPPHVLLLGSRDAPSPRGDEGRSLPPGLARLAREGFRFDNFLGAYPFRAPTWAELFAGQWQRSHGKASGQRDPRRVSLAGVFADAGYDTCFVGARDGAGPPPPGFAREVDPGGHTSGMVDKVLEHVSAPAGRPSFVAAIWDGGPHEVAARVASLLDRLDENDSAGETVVVYTPPFGRAERGGHAGRGLPLIVRSPLRVTANGRSSVAMTPLDVAPTVCGIVGVAKPPVFAGIDYATLTGIRSV